MFEKFPCLHRTFYPVAASARPRHVRTLVAASPFSAINMFEIKHQFNSWGYNTVQLEASSLAPRPKQAVVVMARLKQGGMGVAGAAVVARRQ